MLSNNQEKQLKQLSAKKGRQMQQKFLVEGKKIIFDLLSKKFPFELICTTENYFEEIKNEVRKTNTPLEIITERQLYNISSLQHPQPVFAVAKIYEHKLIIDSLKESVSLILDGISDPGNLGTIIRLADWFGIKNIICSKSTVELFNPKVIQASMGSFSNVNVVYVDSLELFVNSPEINALNIPIIGTTLDGVSYKTIEPQPCFLVLGSEASGISENMLRLLNHKIVIEGNSTKFAESLNVSVAATLVTSYFCNR
jgi:RNA methyltransferase, TrmH family